MAAVGGLGLCPGRKDRHRSDPILFSVSGQDSRPLKCAALSFAHKRQRRNADSYRRRKDGPQGRKACHQSRTGGEYVILR